MDGAAGAPSPLVPFLLVSALALFLQGRSLLKNTSMLIGDSGGDTISTFVFVIPLVALLLVYYTSQSIIIPLTLLLIIYAVTKLFLGPLILIAVIYMASLLSSQYSSQGYDQIRNHRADYRDRDGCEGFGCVLFLLLFLSLHGLVATEGDEGRKWGLALLLMLFYVLYNLSCYQ